MGEGVWESERKKEAEGDIIIWLSGLTSKAVRDNEDGATEKICEVFGETRAARVVEEEEIERVMWKCKACGLKIEEKIKNRSERKRSPKII